MSSKNLNVNSEDICSVINFTKFFVYKYKQKTKSIPRGGNRIV